MPVRIAGQATAPGPLKVGQWAAPVQVQVGPGQTGAAGACGADITGVPVRQLPRNIWVRAEGGGDALTSNHKLMI